MVATRLEFASRTAENLNPTAAQGASGRFRLGGEVDQARRGSRSNRTAPKQFPTVHRRVSDLLGGGNPRHHRGPEADLRMGLGRGQPGVRAAC